MNSKLFLAGLFGLAVLSSPFAWADTVADTPDAVVHYESNTVGAAVAALPLINDVRPSTSARYYIYLCSAGWCSACNKEMPKVIEAYQGMKKSGVAELLLVDYDYTESLAHEYLEKFGVMFPATMSVNAPSLPGFNNPRGIPYAIIVDGNGDVVKSGHASLIQDWQSYIAAYEKEKGTKASFPGSLTLTLDPNLTLAEVDGDEELEELPSTGAKSPVAEALSQLKWFNSKPNLKAEYYIYLQSASWCGPCRAEMPEIAKEYKAMKRSRRVELVLLSGDRTQDAAKAFLKNNKAKFPGTMGSSGGVSSLPGANRLPNYYPAAVIVKADGTVVKAGHGSIVREWRSYTIDSAATAE